MCAPQPAAFTTIVATSAASKAAMFSRASARARSGSPAWAWSAPQQRCARGIATSTPFRVRSRGVARLGAGAGPPPLDLRPGGLDEVPVLDPGWTGALARPAVEAQREVLHDRVGQRQAPVGQRLDEVDPAARGIHLEPVLGVGRG